MEIKVDKVKYLIHKASGTLEKYKSDLVGKLIRKQYSPNDEQALLRHYTMGRKLDEFAIYDSYANQCISAVNEAFASMEASL